MTAIFYISYAVLWGLVIFQSLVLLGLARAAFQTNAEHASEGALSTSNGFLIGKPVPNFGAFDVFGMPIDEKSLVDQASAVLFVSPDCSSCVTTLDELEALKSKVDGNVVVVCRAGPEECSRLRETFGLDVPVIVDEDLSVSEVFDVRVSPTAVLLGANGRIQTYGHPMRAEDFIRLLTESGARVQSEEPQ